MFTNMRTKCMLAQRIRKRRTDTPPGTHISVTFASKEVWLTIIGPVATSLYCTRHYIPVIVGEHEIMQVYQFGSNLF